MTNPVNQVATPYRNHLAQSLLDGEADQKPNNEQESTGTGSDAQNMPATPNGTNDEATSDVNDNSTYKERWVNLKRYHDTKIHELRTEVSELKQKLKTDTQNLKGLHTEAELEEFKKKNPEFFSVLESMVSKSDNSVDRERFETLERELEETRQEKIFNTIKKAHPDYVEIAASNEFNSWIEEQDTYIQDMAKSSKSATAFIRVLDLYKLDSGAATGKGTSTQKSNKDFTSAADAVSTKGSYTQPKIGEVEGRIWTKAEISKLSGKEFDMFEQDIDQAWREGRVR